ncbi:uncharacterized protein LACBIDRAFT_333367 [Laccaria bicolor S238N-H82]|uniref:Predicted protein n=1 Tax=Laccaria bicolor (strain S238N-H82 / ATCC MYA-4686) TaxID=486041 RepID=B0DVP4_LACBS|nr:uncharacterized protein LACBIDRAFT_333367 [Laccaria bicolor S238N-H82]EDR01338.1 predicted protein [Laccaria bicolor S238N-H82]|eukprot:XP_001888045.1 predicted protein [Laccaria bicolor S238N-H82]
MGPIVTRFDDRDSRIQYSSTWVKAGTPLDYLNTTTGTDFAGSGVLFNFTGTGVTVYGSIIVWTGLLPPVSNYTIDSGMPYQFIATQMEESQHQQLFFRATGLSLGQHTLMITNELVDGLLELDYLEVETSADGSTNSSSLTTPISSSLMATATHYATSTALQTSSESATSRVGPPIGVTIGGAITGSTVIMSLILFACFFARRRQHRKKNLPLPHSPSSPQLDMSHAPAGRSSDITPFVIGDPIASFAGSSLREYARNGHAPDRDPGSPAPEGVVPHCAQVPSSAGGRGECHSDLPPSYTALSDVR